MIGGDKARAGGNIGSFLLPIDFINYLYLK